MNIEELHNELKKLNISEDRYFLHGLYGSKNDNEKLSLIIKKGKYNVEYQVYYCERGEKHSIVNFSDEDEACKYILKKFKELNS
jgi:hypothetical protein